MGVILDALFPRRCPACQQETSEPLLCSRCAHALYENANPCPRCALPRTERSCRCQREDRALSAACSPFLYGSELALALQRLKYERRVDVAFAVGRFVSADLARFCADLGAHWIVPIPTHWRSRLARGMDPNLEILAGTRTGLPIVRALRKIRRTPRQAALPRARRLGNLRASFSVPRRYVRALSQRTVVVFDDVITTMATVDEAAATLALAGCQRVAAFSVARSDGQA